MADESGLGVRPMLKSELVNRILAQSPRLFHYQVENLVDVILDEITLAIARGERVELRGFGTFSAKVHPAYVGRNPQNQTAVQVPKKVVPHFKPGKEPRVRLNLTYEETTNEAAGS